MAKKCPKHVYVICESSLKLLFPQNPTRSIRFFYFVLTFGHNYLNILDYGVSRSAMVYIFIFLFSIFFIHSSIIHFLKVSKSRKQIMASWILPKNEQNSLSWASPVLRIVSFVHFLEESRTPYLFFEIYWPLVNPDFR